MGDAPPNLVPNYLAGWMLALALGLLPAAAMTGLAWLRAVPLNLEEEYRNLLFVSLWTSAPLLLLALLGVREPLPWLIGIVPTALLWLLAFVPVDGANIGLGWLMMIAPIPLSIAALVAASRSEWRRG